MTVVISKTDLARNTREIVDQVRHGQTVIVQSYGENQIVLVDALDYQLLTAVVAYALRQSAGGHQDDFSAVIHSYLDEDISLSKTAEQLGLSRFELMERFERLGVPLRLGPATVAEAQSEISAARQGKPDLK